MLSTRVSVQGEVQNHTVGIKANTASSNIVRRCCHSCSKMLDLEPKKERVRLLYT